MIILMNTRLSYGNNHQSSNFSQCQERLKMITLWECGSLPDSDAPSVNVLTLPTV